MGWVVKSLVSVSVLLGATSAFGATNTTNTSTTIWPTTETSASHLEKQWNFAIGSRGFSESKDEGFTSFLYLRGKFTYHLLENLKVFVAPRIEMFSSRVQTRYDDDTYRSQFRLLDGYLEYDPIKELALKVGTHSQEGISGLLVSRKKSFPGAQEILIVPVGAIQVTAMAEQLVPTSSSMNTERSEKEKLPGFFFERLRIGSLDKEEALSWGVNAGHYRWQNIPSNTAFNSSLLGNQVVGDSASSSRMLYAFDGWLAGVEGCLCGLDSFKLKGGLERIRNSLASANAADGQTFSVMPKIVMKQVDLELGYRSFFVESDATVAAYTSSSTVGTNRVGHEYSITTDFKKLGFEIEARVVDADPINANAVQAHFTEYYIGLETHYVSF